MSNPEVGELKARVAELERFIGSTLPNLTPQPIKEIPERHAEALGEEPKETGRVSW